MVRPIIINSGSSHTSKGKEKLNQLSDFKPINIPRAMLTKNCIPMPAYFNNSLLVSFLDFKIQFIFDATVNFPISFKVVKNNLASILMAY
jgi:hypothetical protein